MKPKSLQTRLFLAAFALASLPASLSAQTVVWDGDTDNLYETGTNWVDDVAPADDLTTNIAQFTGADVVLNSTRQVNGLDFAVGNTLSGSGSIEVGSGGITVNGDSTISTAGLILSQATNITLNGTLDISSVITGSDTLTVTAGTATDFSMTGTNGTDDGTGNTLTGNIVFDGINATVSRYFMGGSSPGSTLSLLNGSTLNATSHLVLAKRDIIISGGATINQSGNNNIYQIDGVISGTGGITWGNVNGGNRDKIQLDTGTTNTYTGGTTITGGVHLHVKNANALGDASGGLTFNDGRLTMNGGVNLVDTRSITVEAGNGVFNVNGNSLDVRGAISGAGELTFWNNGNVQVFSENNTHGSTKIDGTQVNLYGATNALGTGAITLDNGGIIKNRDNHLTFTNNIMLGSGTGTFGGGATGAKSGGQFEAGWNKSVTLNGQISGDGPLTFRNDSGHFNVNNTANDYTGQTNIEAKVFGRTGVFGQNDGTAGDIIINGGTMVAYQHLNLDATRTVTIDANGAELVAYNSKAFTFEAVVDGTGAITVANDGGSVQLLNTANSYSGGTTIIGRVNAKSGGLGTGDVTLDDQNGSRGWLQNYDGAATHDNNLIISNANSGGRMKAGWGSDLTINGVVSGAGTLTIEDDSGTVVFAGTSNTFSGDIVLGDGSHGTNTGHLKVASLGGGNYTGTITGDGTFEYVGSGSQTITNVSTYTGATTVSSGTLYVNGDITASSGTTVADGGTIGGSGTVGDLTVQTGGFHKPGNSPDTMTVLGNYTMAGELTVEVEGITPGVGGHDQVDVTGTVDISGGSLATMFSTGTYSDGDLLFIILNDGADAITGTFTGFAQGDTVTNFGGFDWQISYVANGDETGFPSFTGGNDVALLAVVPEPGAAILGSLGLLALLRRRRS